MPVESSALRADAASLRPEPFTDLSGMASVSLPIDKELVMKVIPMPADCNANGDIFGGTTSITVQVEVFAEHFNAQKRYMKVTEASVTYVAIDGAGRPRKLKVGAAEPGADAPR